MVMAFSLDQYGLIYSVHIFYLIFLKYKMTRLVGSNGNVPKSNTILLVSLGVYFFPT